MVRWTRSRLTALGATLRELANYVAAALVLGQFVSDRSTSWGLVAAGIIVWAMFVAVGVLLERE